MVEIVFWKTIIWFIRRNSHFKIIRYGVPDAANNLFVITLDRLRPDGTDKLIVVLANVKHEESLEFDLCIHGVDDFVLCQEPTE